MCFLTLFNQSGAKASMQCPTVTLNLENLIVSSNKTSLLTQGIIEKIWGGGGVSLLKEYQFQNKVKMAVAQDPYLIVANAANTIEENQYGFHILSYITSL